jgi:hypothetical protein
MVSSIMVGKMIKVTDCNFCPYQRQYALKVQCEYEVCNPRNIDYETYSNHEFPEWCPLEDMRVEIYKGTK